MDKPTISLAKNKCYVDGQWVGEPKLPVTNKATGDIMARVPEFGEAETRRAIAAASRAFPGWSKMLAKERSKRVRNWYDLIVEHAERAGAAADQRAGQAAGRGQGRDPLRGRLHRVLRRGGQARLRRDHPDLQVGCPHRRHQAAGRRGGSHHAVELPGRHDHPQGRRRRWRSAAPWCCKPASETPLTALALAALAEKAGIPKGVFNVITGKASVIGKELTSNPTCACSPSPAPPRSAAC